MLYPLMDMFFILLLFFLVTSGTAPRQARSPGFTCITPVEQVGQAQILLQLIDANTLLWLDNTNFNGSVQEAFSSEYYITINPNSLEQRLDRFKNDIGQCVGEQILTVIRCPAEMDYGDIINIEQGLEEAFKSRMPAFKPQFALLEGSVTEIIEANVITHRSDSVEIRW